MAGDCKYLAICLGEGHWETDVCYGNPAALRCSKLGGGGLWGLYEFNITGEIDIFGSHCGHLCKNCSN